MLSNWLDGVGMSKITIPTDVIDFLATWATKTNQSADVCAKRFWDLMINQNISEETKDETIKMWIAEAEWPID